MWQPQLVRVGALAEFERPLIIERTRVGIKAATWRGEIGAKAQATQQISHCREMIEKGERPAHVAHQRGQVNALQGVPGEYPRQKQRLFLEVHRIFQLGCTKVVCHHRELSIKGHLIECSEDGSGCYVALKERLSANDSIRIKLLNIEPLILGKIRHSEGRYWNKKTISGHGVFVTDENSRNVLATFITAQS